MWVNVLMNLVPVALSTVNVLNGSFGASGWVGVGAHAIPLAVLLCYLAYARTGREASAPGAAVPRARVQRSRTN